jgi:surfeit locus 1 family protein
VPFRVLLAPRMLALHAFAVLAVAAAVLLGLWQYGVWQDGREHKTAAVVRARPAPLSSVMTSDEAFPRTGVGKPVTLSGRWDPGATVYVSGRELHGRDGFWAVTPVAVCGGSTSCSKAPAVLVVRGWTPTVADAPAAPSGSVQVTGWLQPGEGSGDGDPDPRDDVIPQLRVPDVLQRVDRDLYGAYVIAERTSPSASAGSARPLEQVTPAALPKASAFTSVRNLLYALEWWVFGGFAVYVWLRWCRDEVTRVTGVPSPV